jgi:hypothetical protein
MTAGRAEAALDADSTCVRLVHWPSGTGVNQTGQESGQNYGEYLP